MLTADYLHNELRDVFAMLDYQEHSDYQNYIASVLEDEAAPENELAIAEGLRRIDPAQDLPRCVFDLIVEIYEDAIEDGNADAMNDLGALYYAGRGCEQDYAKAVFYYDMAASNGNRQAQENLGYCYYYGRDVAVDYGKAFHYFALGAFDGHLVSLYKIGDMYLKGYYVRKNEKEAFCIYNHCLELMTDESAVYAAGPVYLRMGDCFLNGRGTEVNAHNALVCYQKAEVFLYDMVKSGDHMYKGSLSAAIAGQARARAVLNLELP